MNLRIFVTIIILIIGLLAACTRTQMPNPPPAPSESSSAIPLNPPGEITTSSPIASGSAITAPIIISTSTPSSVTSSIVKVVPAPAQLFRICSNAENIFISVKSKNFTIAVEELTKIKSDMKDLNPLVKLTPSIPGRLVDELGNVVNNLEKSINGKKILETMSDSNLVTRYVFDISDYYKTDLPPDLGRLKYLGREIEICLDKNDYTMALNNYEQQKSLWSRSKTLFDATYNSDIMAFDVMMGTLGKDLELKNMQGVKKDLKSIYDKLDALSTDYMKQKKS